MRSSSPWLVVLLGLAATGVARAGDDSAAWPAIDVRGEPAAPPGPTAPRLVRNDDPAEAQRSAPGYRSATTELGYRWWLSKGRADLGLGLGTLAYVRRPTGSLSGLDPDRDATVLASGTVLTLGMRYRTSARSAVFADAAGWHGTGPIGSDAVAGKVGIEFKSARSRWNVAYGGLGLRLAGDARMTLRVRRGGFTISMRRSF